jgi:SAM-dependent methyltransferase
LKMKNIVQNHINFSRKSNSTYRRFWLDACLDSFSDEMCGLVIDLGGKRENKRGSFRPQESRAQAWWYINLDWNTSPNVFADITRVPIKEQSADCIICTEVLEHLENPAACADEIFRLLRPGGQAFISVPFMYPIHADPFDFQRFAEAGLQRMFVGFSTIEIFPMGGYLGVIGLFIQLGLKGIQGQQIYKKVLRRLLTALAYWLCTQDLATSRQPEAWKKFTTGYFMRAIK